MAKSRRKRRVTKRIIRNRIIGITFLVGLTAFTVFSCKYINELKNQQLESLTEQTNSAFTSTDTDEIEQEISYTTDECSTAEESSSQQLAEDVDDLSSLKLKIENYTSGYDGTWSVYVKNLDTGASISIDNSRIYAASLIKLYAMAAAYQQISEGIISESDVYDTIQSMIIYSSNEAFNSIVWTVGKYYISEWCSENGYNDTYQCHGLSPADNAEGLQTSEDTKNYTTAADCGKLLESIYRGECISAEYSQTMLDFLLDQQLTTKIPAGVPASVTVANKTGETDDVSHDAAIVYSDGADYILVVMISAPGYGWTCAENIPGLSELVYNYFNP